MKLPLGISNFKELIKDKEYIEIFQNHNVHSIGLAFCGKEVELVLVSTNIHA